MLKKKKEQICIFSPACSWLNSCVVCVDWAGDSGWAVEEGGVRDETCALERTTWCSPLFDLSSGMFTCGPASLHLIPQPARWTSGHHIPTSGLKQPRCWPWCGPVICSNVEPTSATWWLLLLNPLGIYCNQKICFTQSIFCSVPSIEFQDFYTFSATSLKQELSNLPHILDMFEVGQQGVFPNVKDAPSLKVNYTGKLLCVFVHVYLYIREEKNKEMSETL